MEENIFGGTCARVCPTEVLCEEKCVMNGAEQRPIAIGRLQRYATDALMEDVAAGEAPHPFARAPSTGKTVAVVGAGPAGLACAHRLSMLGHEVAVFEAKPKAGGLNEYGIAAYKMVKDFARKEAKFVLGIGWHQDSLQQGPGPGREAARVVGQIRRRIHRRRPGQHARPGHSRRAIERRGATRSISSNACAKPRRWATPRWVRPWW